MNNPQQHNAGSSDEVNKKEKLPLERVQNGEESSTTSEDAKAEQQRKEAMTERD